MSVVVVGIGAMGAAVAARLQRSGFTVLGVDPYVVDAAGAGEAETTTPAGVRVLRDVGAVAATLEEPPVAVLILVRMPDEVRSVLTELDRHACYDAVPAAILSTMAPTDARQIHARFGSRRTLCEAPISGGVAGASQGSLTVLLCGEAGTWIDAIASVVVRFEEPGQPAAAKLLNNVLAAANVQALAAVLLQSQQFGLRPEQLLEVIRISSGASWMTPHFEQFPVDLLWKDVLLLDGEVPVQLPGLSGKTAFAEQIRLARSAIQVGVIGESPAENT